MSICLGWHAALDENLRHMRRRKRLRDMQAVRSSRQVACGSHIQFLQTGGPLARLLVQAGVGFK